MPSAITPFLLFEGNAEAAITYYTGLFADGEILTVQRYGPENPEMQGRVMHATFRLNGQRFAAIDSGVHHAFGFTPAISFFVDCASAGEVDRLFASLSEGGQVLMPLDKYPFSARYAWVTDRFGVSWQLSLTGS